MKHNRTQLFVDSSFQGRLILRLVYYWAIYHVALWHLLFLFTMLSAAMNHDPNEPAKGVSTLYREFAVDHSGIVVCFLVMLPILGRDLLKFSHRLSGPLIRFRDTMQQMADGQPVEPVTLRKYDLPSNFLSVFNKMVEAWNERVGGEPTTATRDRDLDLVEAN